MSNSNNDLQEPLVQPIDDPEETETETTTTNPTVCEMKLKVINALSYVLNVAITYGVGVGGWMGFATNAERSLQYQTLVTPIGWAFSIWGIIFISQAIWVVAPFIPQNNNNANEKALLKAVGYKYLYIVLLQAAWTFAFALDKIPMSANIMVALCMTLWMTVRDIYAVPQQDDSPKANYWLSIFPIMIHAGWITAATAVNLNVAAVAWKAPATLQFAGAMVSLVVLLGVAITVSKKDKTIPLVLAWASVGVFFQLQNVNETIANTFSSQEIEIAKISSAAVAGLIVIGTLVRSFVKCNCS